MVRWLMRTTLQSPRAALTPWLLVVALLTQQADKVHLTPRRRVLTVGVIPQAAAVALVAELLLTGPAVLAAMAEA